MDLCPVFSPYPLPDSLENREERKWWLFLIESWLHSTLNDILTPLGTCKPCFFVLIPFPVLFLHNLLCPTAEQCDLAGDLHTTFSLSESLLTPEFSDACLSERPRLLKYHLLRGFPASAGISITPAYSFLIPLLCFNFFKIFVLFKIDWLLLLSKFITTFKTETLDA